MKRYLSLLLIALLFCAVISVGCGGGGSSDSSDPEQTENVNNNTSSGDNIHDDYEESRGGSGSISVHIEEKLWSTKTM